MLNFRKAIAATVLLLTLSLTTQAGWISTSAKPTPTPEPTTFTAPDRGCDAEKYPAEEGRDTLGFAADSLFSFLRSVFTMI